MKENTRAEIEHSDDPLVAIFHTNREVSEEREVYTSRAEALNGTPLSM